MYKVDAEMKCYVTIHLSEKSWIF